MFSALGKNRFLPFENVAVAVSHPNNCVRLEYIVLKIFARFLFIWNSTIGSLFELCQNDMVAVLVLR